MTEFPSKLSFSDFMCGLVFHAPFDFEKCETCGGLGYKALMCGCGDLLCGCNGLPYDFEVSECGCPPVPDDQIRAWTQEGRRKERKALKLAEKKVRST
jgi:hypothetical protein